MADDPAKGARVTNEAFARAALIRRYGLSEEAVAQITQLQEAESIGFAEAAAQLGYITQSDSGSHTELVHLPSVSGQDPTPCTALVVAHAPYHARSEQIRSLRTELLLRFEDASDASMLAVLSPCSREGRSHLAAELAIAFAQLGRPTLLVDADMRAPQQHAFFAADNSHGLSWALGSEQRPELQPVAGLPQLSLLTSGALPNNPLELLSRAFFESLVEEWRQCFDFVIFDSPPVSRCADGLAIATVVGHVLSLTHAQHTPYKDMRSFLRRLASTRSRVHGAVINHF